VFVGTANNIYWGMKGIKIWKEKKKNKQEATNIKLMQNQEEIKTNALKYNR